MTRGDTVTKGILYGVSVGPGDPELLTLKAVRAIQDADVIAVPNIGHGRQTALSIAAEYVEGKPLIDCSTPMTRDASVRRAAYAENARVICEHLAEGRNVAYLCLGDIGVYASFAPVNDHVRAAGYDVTIIPGITSFSASAARLGTVLCEGSERLLVAPVMSGNVDEILDVPANKVFMKSGREVLALREKLAERGQLDGASMVANCGLPDEKVFPRLADVTEEDADYFSVVIVKDAR
ncbi:MAG: precorrin-2 C(20)-methyltransferase [Eggerthellaceae bacterium]|nr:precorrin-2 C(20)-methyltransferase [Eggerthellaceae bacterium]